MKIVERTQTSMMPYRNGHYLNGITIEENKPTLDGTRTYNQIKLSFTIKKDGADDRIRDIYKNVPATGKSEMQDSEYFNYMKFILGAYLTDEEVNTIILSIFGDKDSSIDNMVFTKKIVAEINSRCAGKEIEVLYTPDIEDWKTDKFKTWTKESGEEAISQTICKSSFHCGNNGFMRLKGTSKKLEVAQGLAKKASAWNSRPTDPTSTW